MAGHSHDQEIEMGSERSFGLVFFCFFMIVAAFPMLAGAAPRIWAVGIGSVFGAIAFLRPEILAPLNRLWFRFGLLLGKIVAPIVMSLIFFLAVLPTGVIMRLLGKDLLRRKLDRSAPSYWIKREMPVGPMRNQF